LSFLFDRSFDAVDAEEAFGFFRLGRSLTFTSPSAAILFYFTGLSGVAF
jgi:hypothetical protein